MSRPLLLNAFAMNCVGHINHGLWTHPRDRSADYNDIGHWTHLVQTLERGLFDGLFLADIVGAYDVYEGSLDLTLRESIQLPLGDPLPLVGALLGMTRHLGFGVTVNLTYEQPYLLARRFSTLDHLSRGRIGWNIVTGYLDSAARAMGLPVQPEHDSRYDRADEFLDVAYQLGEGSWDDDAVVRDRAARTYTRPDRVRPVRHRGPWFQVDGVHLCEPSPQRTPLLYQAGSSGRGQRFAARHAECVFISGQTRAAAKRLVDELRDLAVDSGRRREDIKVFMGATVVVAPTDAEAQAKLGDYLHHANPEAGLAHFAAGTGIDFSRYGMDEPIAPPGHGKGGQGDAMQSAVKVVTAGPKPQTRRELLAQMGLGGRYTPIVGSPQTVADELVGWAEDTGIDGFNLARTVVPECFEDFVDLVVPELQQRGVFKTAYAEGTLRDKLFGRGPHLPAHHVGARSRPVQG
ncbi:MAG: LLM class flavin-dependent oxidoreductase [Ideonella sp.]|nr:LLM class flavin-dependent oxidoreductase [Ideonella sp.]